MHTIRNVPPPAPASRDDAAWPRIAVKYADRASAMPLIRLDRHGLTVAADDDVDPPAPGLPRQALIVGDFAPLCELRLIAREAMSEQGQRTAVILQPSRADDHARLWQVLREYKPRWDEWHSISGHRAEQLSSFDRSTKRDDTLHWRTDMCVRELDSPSAREIESRGSVSCDAVFSLASQEDAWFFSRWLDYHFAEVRARARMSGAAADLRDIFLRVVEHEVEVRFLFQSAEQVVRTSTELTCRWITAEAARQLGMTVEHWLLGMAAACGSLAGWSLGAATDSRTGTCSFLSIK